jgi:hypothetical protein
VKPAGPPLLETPVPALLRRWEGAWVCLLAWLLMIAVPLAAGGLDLGWDALNHHIYLGWTAQRPRFDQDFLAAGYQSFQAPYLNWPVYRMAVLGWSGAQAGFVLASLHVLAVWPLWSIARTCLPGDTLFELALRILAVAMAFASSLVLSALDSTMNDVLAATPLLWSVALALPAAAGAAELGPASLRRRVALSGMAAGLSVALKLSNGPCAVFLPVLWWACGSGLRQRLQAALVGSLSTVAAFAAAYGYWGWQLWSHFGNPVFPFLGPWFELLRASLHWGR